MARLTNKKDISPVLDAARQWIDRCLIADDSILGARQLWTDPLVNEVHKAFVQNPDLGKDRFPDRIERSNERRVSGWKAINGRDALGAAPLFRPISTLTRSAGTFVRFGYYPESSFRKICRF